MFKAIGISNFYPNTFPKIVEDAKVIPVVNQCETHVLYQQRKMLEYLKPYDTALEAWSPLAEGKHGIFKNPTLVAIGEKYGKTSAQIALKFLVQNGIIVIPKTTHKERISSQPKVRISKFICIFAVEIINAKIQITFDNVPL